MQRKRDGEQSVSDKPKKDKAAKFRELANKRLTEAVYRLRRLANLGNRAQYVRTDEQTKKLLDTIDLAVKRVKDSFALDHDTSNGEEAYF